jgi:truncated hemoglobin YjbI
MTSDAYQAIGRTAGCRKLSETFYGRVKSDPILRPLFPGKTLTCAIEEFTAFLVQFLGGPSEDTQRRWWLSLHESHRRFKIGPQQRDAWMSNMVKALDEAQIDEPIHQAFRGLFERASAYVIDHEPPAVPLAGELSLKWDAQLELDQAVTAIRAGDTDRAIALVESGDRDHSVLAGLLALMIGTSHSGMLDYVRGKLVEDPALIRERYNGRTLLHVVSAAGNVSLVELVLRLGADPNAADGGDHPPLYSVGNECRTPGGPGVVRALVAAGANVNANGGVKRCTALHMAARRGSVEIAQALLDCGADIEAQDSLGETPLRRAVNCEKLDVAALLLARGANRHSMGSKGLTPLLVARSAAMKRLLQSGRRE